MLKRYQVLLPEWLEEHVRNIADRFDLSFSEVIRGEICFAILVAIGLSHPDYKPDIKPDEIISYTKEFEKDEMKREDLHRHLSKLYFETRKAMEYWLKKNKTSKKK